MDYIYKIGQFRLIQVKKHRCYRVQRRVFPFIWLTLFTHTMLKPAERKFQSLAFADVQQEA